MSPRSAVRLVKTFSASVRSLYTISYNTNRPDSSMALQRLAFGFNSRRSSVFHASHAVHHFSQSSRYDGDTQKPLGEKIDAIDKLQDSALIGDQVYWAPMSRAVRLMKAVSVTSCVLTSIGMPVLCIISEQDTSTIGKCAEVCLMFVRCEVGHVWNYYAVWFEHYLVVSLPI
ncbi:unnamed protein product [Peronospora belbahrii]|uniref:Uncharacterized protein n=1 Tax=Peronospora belbahrii TaxID=622444 RepID=A0ABN8CTQ4_9STRA|nr:unnamed protein product [Peronospora belbahrii]